MSAECKIFWSQCLAAGTLSIIMFTIGLSTGWSSPYLAKLSMLENVDGIPKATQNQLSWMSSLMNITRIFSVFVGVVIQETVGRKMALCFSGVPMLISWICVALATDIQWLYAFRILCGFSTGIVTTTMGHHVAEIADPQIRGSLVVWNMYMYSVGIFIGNLIGPYISMQIFAYISIFVTMVFLGLFPLIPDSPYWHVTRGNIHKAEKSLKWYRRKPDVKEELIEIQEYIKKSDVSLKERLAEFKQRQNLKNFGLIFLSNVFMYFGAFNIIINYMEIIVIASKVSIITPSTLVTINGFFSIISGLISTFMVDRFGRRLLLITSSLGMALSLTGIGINFMLLKCNYDPVSLNWLPCVCLIVYTISYSCGMISIPNALVAELFPANLKSIASLLFNGTAAFFYSLSTITFLPLQNLIGPSYLYFFYSSGVYVAVIYYYFFLYETKGQSLQNIQENQKKRAEH